MNYPERYFRGIAIKDHVEDNYPTANLFKEFSPNPDRTDDYNEVSINWEDNENSLRILLNQKNKRDEIQFKFGIAVFPRSELDKLKKNPILKDILDYERRAIEGNEYHGNILLKKSASKAKRDMLASAIALSISDVISHNNL